MGKFKMKWLFLVFFVISGLGIHAECVSAQTWYVSSLAIDPEGENDGKSKDAPFDHLSRLIDVAERGDTILLEKGSVFRGEAFFLREGMRVSAYGNGKAPRIYGSQDNGADASKWTLFYQKKGVKIWKYHRQTCDVGMIHLGGKKYATRVYSYWNGKKEVCTMNVNRSFSMKKELKYDLSFYQDAPETDSEFVNSEDGGMGNLYLRCDKGNPGEIFSSIEFAEGISNHSYGALLHCDEDHITIDGITCMYINTIGISAGGHNHITIKNCSVGWVGGTPLKNNAGISGKYGFVPTAGEGIRIDGDQNVCRNCYVHDCFDGGILAETSPDMERNTWHSTVKNNRIERCMNGIYFLVHDEDAKRFTQIATVEDNVMKDCGYGWTQDKNYYFTWGNSADGAGINYYSTQENPKSKITLKGNRIKNARTLGICNKKTLDQWAEVYGITSPNGCRF